MLRSLSRQTSSAAIRNLDVTVGAVLEQQLHGRGINTIASHLEYDAVTESIVAKAVLLSLYIDVGAVLSQKRYCLLMTIICSCVKYVAVYSNLHGDSVQCESNSPTICL